ncbi:4'-phosphopantetheinyl transferase superfamily protein [Paenibacillus mesophilus]|uniref:4'-phosphopantetheinyl transferase family protein n=1 Tax=Paenibacillus mesophilus TaxID=2582849 RepID=UPI00110D674D|nr:4'-phosphopantetheinyl transferase superfamily protein [Paenibacillus mesophilus]TMV45527.1 4'-phosphopantetheinyl transferase superfamily protein [Paenibacillus mesophilus]
MVSISAVQVPESIPPELMSAWMSLISADKRRKIAKFVRKEDQYRSLIGELLVRSTIVRHTGMTNDDIRFACNEYGKPALEGDAAFSFNLSHSGGWVVLAWSATALPLGIDVEQIVPIDYRIAESFFTSREKVDLFAREGDGRLDYFYRLWTLKESYIKAIGKGLSMPLDRFTVAPAAQGGWHSPEAPDFSFTSFRLDAVHLVAACSTSDELPDTACILDWCSFIERVSF